MEELSHITMIGRSEKKEVRLENLKIKMILRNLPMMKKMKIPIIFKNYWKILASN